MTYILRTHQLTKALKGNEIVTGVSMNVRQGKLMAFSVPMGRARQRL